MWILSWLLARYQELSSVTDRYFRPIIDAARFSYFWAVDKGRDAITRSWIYTTAVTAIESARRRAGLQQIMDAASNLFGFAQQKIQLQKNYFDRLITNNVISLKNKIISGLSTAKVEVFKFVTNPINWIRNNSGKIGNALRFISTKVIPAVAIVYNLLPRIANNDRESIWTVLERQKNTLVWILENPADFFITIAQTYLLVILEWLGAYALGTVEATLPVFPKLSELQPDFPGKPPTIKPDGIGKISAPVEPKYISGNIFSTAHPGLDLGLITGQPVYAVHSGTVTFAGTSPAGFGIYVVLAGNGIWSRYFHLSQIKVSSGQRVASGQVVGSGGSTGFSTGPHLHLEIKIHNVYVDPLTIIP